MIHRQHFGFKQEPFPRDIATKDLLKLPSLVGVKERLDYCLNIGGVMLVFGDVGSGKTTALRWAFSHYHSSDVKILELVATSGSISELYRQIAGCLDLQAKTLSRVVLLNECKKVIREMATGKKQRIILCIDEAQLLRREVLAELHTITNFDQDGSNFLTLLMCGTPSLIEHLQYRIASPLASRVMSKAQIRALKQPEMEEYLNHHLRVAGVKSSLFDPNAITAIQQGSAGGLRRANQLAAGGLVAAANENCKMVSADHIRTASSELL